MTVRTHPIGLPCVAASDATSVYPDGVAWFVGSGRSGTTWMASLLNAEGMQGAVSAHACDAHAMDGRWRHALTWIVSKTAWFDGLMGCFEVHHLEDGPRQRWQVPANATRLIVKDVLASLLAGPSYRCFPTSPWRW